MAKNDENKKDENTDGGFSLGKDGINCFTCKCRKNFFSKTKKRMTDEIGRTTVEECIATTSVGFGRNITPMIQPRTLTIEQRIEDLERKLEKNTDKNIADIDIGFRRSVSLDERVLRLEKEVEELKKHRRLSL